MDKKLNKVKCGNCEHLNLNSKGGVLYRCIEWGIWSQKEWGKFCKSFRNRPEPEVAKEPRCIDCKHISCKINSMCNHPKHHHAYEPCKDYEFSNISNWNSNNCGRDCRFNHKYHGEPCSKAHFWKEAEVVKEDTTLQKLTERIRGIEKQYKLPEKKIIDYEQRENGDWHVNTKHGNYILFENVSWWKYENSNFKQWEAKSQDHGGLNICEKCKYMENCKCGSDPNKRYYTEYKNKENIQCSCFEEESLEVDKEIITGQQYFTAKWHPNGLEVVNIEKKQTEGKEMEDKPNIIEELEKMKNLIKKEKEKRKEFLDKVWERNTNSDVTRGVLKWCKAPKKLFKIQKKLRNGEYKGTNYKDLPKEEWEKVKEVFTLKMKHIDAYELDLKEAELCKITNCYNVLSKASEKPKKCPDCDTKIRRKAKFCEGCGGKVK